MKSQQQQQPPQQKQPPFIFPMLYKSGIRRDNTDFEPVYCKDGYWVRFDQGFVQKMGGMSSPLLEPKRAGSDISDIRIFTHSGSSDKAVVFYAGGGDIFKSTHNTNFTSREDSVRTPISDINAETALYQSAVVVHEGRETIVYLITNTAKNIADNTQGTLIHSSNIEGRLTAEDFTTVEKSSYSSDVSGGLVYAAPFLFLYGANGLVQYSSRLDPFVFTNRNQRSIEGSGSVRLQDKVVFGTKVRGGGNSPSLIFWTLTSVEKISNVATGEDGPVNFQLEVISSESSIMSSRAVVEYNGQFYWPGTERFYHYNGLVLPMKSIPSQNFFYDNIDLENRQLVFGVRNTRYSELWWFYPEKGQDASNVQNTRVLIFNHALEAWYDTPIHRSAGFFSESFGFLVTHGQRLPKENKLPPEAPSVPKDDDVVGVWRHEIGVNERYRIADIKGSQSEPIMSYVTTPIISMAAFNPTNPNMGINNFINLRHLEPDVVFDEKTDEMSFEVIQTRWAQSMETVSAPYTFSGNTEKVDLRIQARNIRFKFQSNCNFKLGNIRLYVSIGDGN